MARDSKVQIAAIELLEQQCKQYEQINLNIGIEHLVKEDGDNALLYYSNEKMIGCLSWYTSDGSVANINGMVHPNYRRQGVFRSLLQHAINDMKPQGIQSLSYRVPIGSQSGLSCVRHLGAEFDRSEYSMTLANLRTEKPSSYPGLYLRPMQPQDFDFMVMCASQAFGDSEAWSRDYFTRTNESSRMAYIAFANNLRVGMIRINQINETLAFIHDFCILPSHQGKGIGQEVLTNTVSLLLEKRHTHIKLGVVTENERALNLYRNVGFEVTSQFLYYSGDL